jgi:hypothetical protein
MKRHTSMRTFDVGAFFDGGEEKWTAYVNGGPVVFGVAKAAKMWSDGQFLFSHIENKLMFQESQPYHSQQLNFGMRFEIYLQAFRVAIDKANFLRSRSEGAVLSHGQEERGRLELRGSHVRRILRGWQLLLCRTLQKRRLASGDIGIHQEQQEIRRVHQAMRNRQ